MYPLPWWILATTFRITRPIDPLYGTLADFDHLISEAKKRNIRVIMDYVANHTSDQHPWFKESRSSRTSPKRDWYILARWERPWPSPNNWLFVVWAFRMDS